MDTTLEQLERDVDRELAAITGELREPVLDEAVRERVKASVRAEALRLGPIAESLPGRWRIGARASMGVAAAALLAIAIRAPLHWSPAVVESGAEAASADALLDDWLAAAADSSTAVSMLYDETWIDNADEGAGNDPLDSMENTFESFERVLGA